jgi:hypothetical protein
MGCNLRDLFLIVLAGLEGQDLKDGLCDRGRPGGKEFLQKI